MKKYIGDYSSNDLAATLSSKDLLRRNRNLFFWYRTLYQFLVPDCLENGDSRVLEIGSGASPLKAIAPACITSDVLPLDYVDHVFDCHEVDSYDKIPDGSIDVILLVNVLHHLRDPILFLNSARTKLAKTGEVIMVEPFFSMLSYPIYQFLHHEEVNFSISEPILPQIKGPLSSSNQAIPYLIFFRRKDWLAQIAHNYDLDRIDIQHYTGIAYFATGGISRVIPIPHGIYRIIYELDLRLARAMPRLFSAFFITRLRPKS
jgi:SAM-dependent methyltransferase